MEKNTNTDDVAIPVCQASPTTTSSDSDGDDDPIQAFHVKTFLDMTERLEKIRKLGETDASESSVAKTKEIDTAKNTVTDGESKAVLTVRTHASVIYYGDRLALSTEIAKFKMTEYDYETFCRVVNCFTRLLMGTHTNGDVRRLKKDHDYLLRRWDWSAGEGRENDPGRAVSDEIHELIKNMLETPVYYTSSCMALIACGKMLRNLFEASEKRSPRDFEDLLRFVRVNARHNPVNPFDCDCSGPDACSSHYKTLLSLILEVPSIVHNQTYTLQILAYLVDEKEGREEIFVINMKNVVSPGLLDKIPIRLAMLVGSLEEEKIRGCMRSLRGSVTGSPFATGRRPTFNQTAVENIVTFTHDPRVSRLIDSLPGARVASVELALDRCAEGTPHCLNAGDVARRGGGNRCCGHLKLDPTALLASSVSLAQLCVYLYTDTRDAPARSKRHYFVRDVMSAVAKTTVNLDESCLEDVFGYLDRCDMFTGFSRNPIFTSTFYKLFQSYLKSMKNVTGRFKVKRRKVNRLLEKMKEG